MVSTVPCPRCQGPGAPKESPASWLCSVGESVASRTVAGSRRPILPWALFPFKVTSGGRRSQGPLPHVPINGGPSIGRVVRMLRSALAYRARHHQRVRTNPHRRQTHRRSGAPSVRPNTEVCERSPAENGDGHRQPKLSRPAESLGWFARRRHPSLSGAEGS